MLGFHVFVLLSHYLSVFSSCLIVCLLGPDCRYLDMRVTVCSFLFFLAKVLRAMLGPWPTYTLSIKGGWS